MKPEIMEAVEEGDAARLRDLLKQFPDEARVVDDMGNTVMMLVVTRATDWVQEVFDTLVAAGTPINARNHAGRTVLSVAIDSEDRAEDIDFRYLLARGANPNTADMDGWTPLMLAVSSPEWDPDLIEALIEAGADPYAANKEGHTAISLAEETGDEELIAIVTGSEPEED